MRGPQGGVDRHDTHPLSFGGRLGAAFAAYGQLCVGIDPHRWLLNEWGLPDTAAGARGFGLRVVDAAAGSVGIVKPQVAFFERHGSAGFAALEDTLAAARAAGLIIIADAKRGDLGTSVEAYGQAWLTPGGPLEADAMTINAYLGLGALEAPIALAVRHGKGLFVLAATSNPEAVGIQTATIAVGNRRGMSVAAGIVEDVIDRNRANDAAGHDTARSGALGVVIGATVDSTAYGIDLDQLAAVAVPVLAPGFGHQGARFDQLPSIYAAAAPFAVVCVSRSILSAGPTRIAQVIASQAREVAECRA